MTASKEFVHPASTKEVRREMARCKECRSWWSVAENVALEFCPCGGELVLEDMAKHAQTVPYVPSVPAVSKAKS